MGGVCYLSIPILLQYIPEDGLSIYSSLNVKGDKRLLVPDCVFTTSINERERNLRIYIEEGTVRDTNHEERNGKGLFFMKINKLLPLRINQGFIFNFIPFQNDIIRIFSNSFETTACLRVFSSICDNGCIHFSSHLFHPLDLLTQQVNKKETALASSNTSFSEPFQLPIIYIESGLIVDATQKACKKGGYFAFIALDPRRQSKLPDKNGNESNLDFNQLTRDIQHSIRNFAQPSIEIGFSNLTTEVQQSIKDFSENGFVSCLQKKGFKVTIREKRSDFV